MTFCLTFNLMKLFSRNENIVLILCENLLYGISDTSNIRFMKRLDYVPMCFCSFVAGWYYGLYQMFGQFASFQQLYRI